MIKRYKNITVSKISDHEGTVNKPTHSLSISEYDKFTKKSKNKKTVGSLWTKDGVYGKFLSGLMSDKRTYKTPEGEEKFFEGYCIVSEKELDELEATLKEVMGKENHNDNWGTLNSPNASMDNFAPEDEVIDETKIPF